MSISFRPSARQPGQDESLADPNPNSVRAIQSQLLRLRYTLLAGFLIAIVMPMLIRHVTTGISVTQPTQYNTALGGSVALLFGVLGYRRLHIFPGIAAGGYIFMSLSVTFGVLAIFLFLMRINYGRIQFLSSYMLAIAVYIYIHQKISIHRRLRLGVVPSATTVDLPTIAQVDWIYLDLDLGSRNSVPDVDAIMVDLHTDHADDWDTAITNYVLNGIPVYHFKQALEQMTGRVEINHLSENTLGSLNPNDVYLKVKAAGDAVCALALLAVLWPLMVVAGILIRLDSPGPALFRQQRTGYRGKPFTVYKLRTMRQLASGSAANHELRKAAMTQEGDPRITRLGGFLRRSRLDELPQLINILKGDMSLIGPRPEAVALSQWYEEEIPFYHYRHLIKPGVTGWAQVNQGHVTDVADVREKLHLDFYYVKNFSFWLDVLIAARTVRTILTGHGAR